MNAENFHQYLRNPSMLHQLNYQELKSLVLQYPYSSNLRNLMLAKSILDGQREYDKNLVLASLSSTDRRKLRQLVIQFSTMAEAFENATMTEDFLELKDLSTLEDIIEVGPPVADVAHAVTLDPSVPSSASIEFLDDLSGTDNELDAISTEDGSEDLEDVLVDATASSASDEPVEIGAETKATPSPNEEEGLETGGSTEAVLDGNQLVDEPLTTADTETDKVAKPITPAPSPKSAFSSYRKQMHFHRPGLLANKEGILAKKEPNATAQEKTAPSDAPNEADAPLKYVPPADVAREVAAKSVVEDSTIATETLAGILARQGHFDKAIRMYEKLGLQYPEKKDTFAAKIKELKNK